MTRLPLSHAIRFARQCGERYSYLTAPVLYWRYTFDVETDP
jgi:hypothetical protein